MSEWWTYSLSDLILFTEQTYYRLFEIYNQAIWPIQIIAIVFALLILALVLKKYKCHGRIIAAILSISWLWVAWSYLYLRFAEIHWVASYYALAFIIEAMIIIWSGVINNAFKIEIRSKLSGYISIGLTLTGILLFPLLTALNAPSWKQTELFAITPDPTVIATLGLLLVVQGSRWWLYIIPVLWCLVSVATLWVLESSNAILLLLCVIAVFLHRLSSAHKPENQDIRNRNRNDNHRTP